jgi:outer membrane protein OmpA-like peptidoglycan-associated protein
MSFRLLFILLMFGEMVFSQQVYELTVYFDTDVSILHTSEQQKIKDVLNELNVHRIYEISVDGYCDDRADDAYNLELSQKRAEHVKTFFDATLKNKRIRVSLEGKGEIALDSIKNVALQRQQNRRVDIVIVTLPGTNVNYVIFCTDWGSGRVAKCIV